METTSRLARLACLIVCEAFHIYVVSMRQRLVLGPDQVCIILYSILVIFCLSQLVNWLALSF